MKERFDHLTIPQVILVLGAMALALAGAVWIPDAKWAVIPWETVIALVLSGGAGLGALAMRPRPEAARASATPVPSAPLRPTRTRSPEDGSAPVELLLDLVGFAACASAAVWLALMAHGCGASALRSHATATLVATVAVSSAEDVYLAHLDAAEQACSDEACVLAARDGHAPAKAALVLVRVAVAAYRDAVEIAEAADETGDVMGALVTAAMRVVARWAEVVTGLALVGVEVPALPIGGPA